MPDARLNSRRTSKCQAYTLLHAADRYAYTGCGSTAYFLSFYLRDEQILIDIRKPCRTSARLVRITGLSPAGPYQLWCSSLRIATNTRPTRNIPGCQAWA